MEALLAQVSESSKKKILELVPLIEAVELSKIKKAGCGGLVGMSNFLDEQIRITCDEIIKVVLK
jgi:hypothetical protein